MNYHTILACLGSIRRQTDVIEAQLQALMERDALNENRRWSNAGDNGNFETNVDEWNDLIRKDA